MKKIVYSMPQWGFTVIVAVAILYLTLVPKPLPDTGFRMFPNADKVVHALMFGGLMFVVTLDWIRSRGRSSWTIGRVMFAFVAVTLSGGLIEVLQDYMDMGRGGDWLDFAADTAGAVLSAFISPHIVMKILK